MVCRDPFPELLGDKEPSLKSWGHDFNIYKSQAFIWCSVNIWWGGRWCDNHGSFRIRILSIPWEMVVESTLKVIVFSARKVFSVAGLTQGRVESCEVGSGVCIWLFHILFIPFSNLHCISVPSPCFGYPIGALPAVLGTNLPPNSLLYFCTSSFPSPPLTTIMIIRKNLQSTWYLPGAEIYVHYLIYFS